MHVHTHAEMHVRSLCTYARALSVHVRAFSVHMIDTTKQPCARTCKENARTCAQKKEKKVYPPHFCRKKAGGKPHNELLLLLLLPLPLLLPSLLAAPNMTLRVTFIIKLITEAQTHNRHDSDCCGSINDDVKRDSCATP